MTIAYTSEALLSGLGRNAVEQITENLNQALRALELAPRASTDFTPHPLVVVRAEIENAKRYLRIAVSVDRDGAAGPDNVAIPGSVICSSRRATPRAREGRGSAGSGSAHPGGAGLAFAT